LVKELTVLAQVVGFDPYMGFYHQPRYGRPSLALDVMEEFRPLIADSVVITATNTGALSGRDFVRVGPSIGLAPAGRKKFIEVFEHRISDLITHPTLAIASAIGACWKCSCACWAACWMASWPTTRRSPPAEHEDRLYRGL
jgi:CRISPR-associated endonuclease Cas1